MSDRLGIAVQLIADLDGHHLLLKERPEWLEKWTPNAGRFW